LNTTKFHTAEVLKRVNASSTLLLMQHSVTELPFNSFLGIESVSEPTQMLRLPAGAQYLNHLGTVHASAQLALAEATSGEFLRRAFGPDSGVIPVVRRLESKFRKPANGAVTSTISTPPETLEQLRADLAAKGRAVVSIVVELHDESGAYTLSATVEWFITMLP
jgi:acyl-coenzyme A thioesterase PaaI-like protein